MRPELSDPKLTLFARASCDLCREARRVLDGVGIKYVLRFVSLNLQAQGKLHVWDENGQGPIGWASMEEIPAVPALLVRDREPSLIFASFEQILAFAAGRTFSGPESQQQSRTEG